jgi:hypothetical protein
MNLGLLLLIILIIACVGGLPYWPYSQSWGHGPSSVLGVVVIILVVLLLLGKL